MALESVEKTGPESDYVKPRIQKVRNRLNIREVIAFPLNQQAQDLMMNAPNYVTEQQLRELHIKIRGTGAEVAQQA